MRAFCRGFNYSTNNDLANSCAASVPDGCYGVGVYQISPGALAYPHVRRKSERHVHMNNTSYKTKPRTVRIKNEAVEYFEGKPLNRMIESLMEYMERGQIEYGEGGLEVKGAFMVDEAIVKDLKMIGEMYDMTFDDMFEELHRAIDEGEIDIEEGRFVYPKVEEKA